MEQWQADLLAQIAMKVDECREGKLSLTKLVEDSRGMFDAANVSDNTVRGEFEAVWAPVSGELDLRTESWSRPEWVSEDRLEAVLADLREWAVRVNRPS